MDRIEVEESLNNLIDEVEIAKENLSLGKDFGLNDVSERIAEVCAAATSLPDEDVLAIQPLLQRLRDDLTSFSEDIEETKARSEIKDNIIDVPTD